jgi:Rhs element Vgr protein
VRSIDVWTGVNKIPKARLALFDGDASAETFPISETSTLIPGATLEISLGYDNNNAVVFSGVIYRQGLETAQNANSVLIVEATDNAIKMTLSRRNAIYENTTDSDLFGKLIGNAGLSKDVAATSAQLPSVVQYYATDWDLMVMRAELNSMVVIVEAGKVAVTAPDTSKAPVLTLTYGDSILEFRSDMDASTQYAPSAIQSFAWDPATQALAQSGTATANVTEAGDLTSAKLAAVFSISPYLQETGAEIDKSSLTAWSSGDLLKVKLAKIRGHVMFAGSALAKTGTMIALSGLGDRFNGNVFVSGVHQSVSEGFWRTTAEFGLSPNWFASSAPNIPAPGASGQLPPINGLQTGIVQKIDGDPDGEYRVYVTLPILQATGKLGVWARLGSFYASNGIGAEFYPETGDEVVVAFMNDDPRFPVIVGSLYSKTLPPPVVLDAANKQKTIVTKSKLRIDFFEDKKAIELSTPKGQSIRMDDDAGTITVKDSNGNKATFASGGITLESASNMELKAKGNVTIQAGGNLALKASANLTADGLQIKHTAQTSFEAAGSAQAKLTSTGILTIQGSLVKIN